MILLVNILIHCGLIVNFLWYWIVLSKNFPQISRRVSITFLTILMALLLSIPILNMRFLVNKSYFQELWIGFILLGALFVVMGVLLFKKTIEISLENGYFIGKFSVLNKGVYEVVRHPIYLSYILIFIGFSFIFDSVISIILIPIIIIIFEIQAYCEEKYLFMKKFKKKYAKYKKKTPKRLMVPSPLNAFLLIIAFFVLYLGMVNFDAIFS
ncbi:MAG: membrane protein of unknown function [Promethearchaeota archaeon]|nr:MAG: membrane protein of unknown function [Candidatus Lokiarchaeota archaeon]